MRDGGGRKNGRAGWRAVPGIHGSRGGKQHFSRGRPCQALDRPSQRPILSQLATRRTQSRCSSHNKPLLHALRSSPLLSRLDPPPFFLPVSAGFTTTHPGSPNTPLPLAPPDPRHRKARKLATMRTRPGLKSCLKITPPITPDLSAASSPCGSGRTSPSLTSDGGSSASSCGRKTVAFCPEDDLEEVFWADEWDRTPAAVTPKLSYQYVSYSFVRIASAAPPLLYAVSLCFTLIMVRRPAGRREEAIFSG